LVLLQRMLDRLCIFYFFQAEDGIRDRNVTGVQTCALPICCILLLICTIHHLRIPFHFIKCILFILVLNILFTYPFCTAIYSSFWSIPTFFISKFSPSFIRG